MVRLTQAEKNNIIINESRGIQHPDYYVCHTKTGGVQVRKRKTPLSTSNATPTEQTPKQTPVEQTEKPIEQHTEQQQPEQQKVDNDLKYEMVTNKQLLEKMLNILEKNTECKDKNLNDVEKEKVTDENKEFAESIKEKIEHCDKEEELQQQLAKEVQQPIKTAKTMRRSRQIIQQPLQIQHQTQPAQTTQILRKRRSIIH